MSIFVKIKNKINYLSMINREMLMLMLSLAIVLTVNLQLLSSFFWRDDYLNLYQISNWNPAEYIFSMYGGHMLIFRNLIFFTMFKIFGMNSFFYFLTVLLTHLGCSYILYKIIHLLTGKIALAAACTMIWGICPVNYPALAWYSVYGHIIVGFLFLLFLYDLIRIKKGDIIFSLSIQIRWSIYFLLMASSFGAGLAISCLSPAAIVIILWENNKKWKIALSMLPVIMIILLLFIYQNSIYYYFSGEVNTVKNISVSMALGNYKIIVEMFLKMFAYSIYCMAAFPMLFFISTLKYSNASFFVSIPVIVLFIFLFFRSRKYIQYYAVLSIFFLGLIGLTAYGRAPIYKIFGVPISTASMIPRYYYVIFAIVIIILVLMLDEILHFFPVMMKIIVPVIFIVITVSIYPSIHLAKTIEKINISEHERKLYYKTISDIEKIIRSYPVGSSVFIDNQMYESFSIFLPSDTDFPGKAAVFSINYPDNVVEGRRVYFVEKDCIVAEKNIEKKKWRISSLMVSACDRNKKSDLHGSKL